MAWKRRPMPSHKPCWQNLWLAKTGFRALSASFGNPSNRRGVLMKTMRAFWVATALLSAAMCPALVGRAEKPMAAGQQDPVQQEKQSSEMAVLLQPNNESGEGQEARQKVVLEMVAADTQVVKGKAYSADTSTETVQTLADGNRIVRRTVSKFYRDSDGRTRREQTFGNVDPEHPTPHEVKVFVDDPVTGTAFVL